MQQAPEVLGKGSSEGESGDQPSVSGAGEPKASMESSAVTSQSHRGY